jgi:hypothetical protein
MCSSLCQSINVNSKHVAHTNKKVTNNGGLLAPSPDADLPSLLDDDDDDDNEYLNSNENEFGSSGSSDFIGNPDTDDFDKFQNSGLPFFLKEPENEYIVKKRPAKLKCSTTHALQVIFNLLLLLLFSSFATFSSASPL